MSGRVWAVTAPPVVFQCRLQKLEFLQWHPSVGLFQLSFLSGVPVYPASIRWVAQWYPSVHWVNQWHSSGIPMYTGPPSVHWLWVRGMYGQSLVPANNDRNISLPLRVWGNPQSPMDSLHKGPLMRKVFPCHAVSWLPDYPAKIVHGVSTSSSLNRQTPPTKPCANYTVSIKFEIQYFGTEMSQETEHLLECIY